MSNKPEMGDGIIKKWKKLLEKEPNLPPSMRAQRIAAELNLDPISVTKYKDDSPDQ